MVVIASKKQPPNEAEDKTRVGKMAQGQAEMFISQKCSFLKCWKCPKPTTESLEKNRARVGKSPKIKTKQSKKREREEADTERQRKHTWILKNNRKHTPRAGKANI